MMKQLAITSARVNTLREVLQIHEEKRQRVIHILNRHGKGITPPWETVCSISTNEREVSQTALGQTEDMTGDNHTVDDLRARISEGVHGMVDPSVSGVFGKKLVQRAVDESFRLASDDRKTSTTDTASGHLGLDIAKNLIKELSLSTEEVDKLVSRIERDHGDSGLRQAITQGLEKEATTGHSK